MNLRVLIWFSLLMACGHTAPPSSDINLSTPLDPLTTGFTFTGTGMVYRYSVNTAGDMNQDGYDDIVIAGSSKVSVIYGGPKSSTSGLNLDTQSPVPATTGFTITGVSSAAVSAAGDINKDGYADIVIGGSSQAYVIYGRDNSLMSNLNVATLNPLTTGFMITGPSGVNFGFAVSKAGDFNKDGYDDILIGAYSASQAYVIYGGDNSLMKHLNLNTQPLLPSTTGFTITAAASSGFGDGVSPAGDVNKDGYDDLLIGAYAVYKGYVIYGREKSLTTDMNLNTQPLVPSSTGFTVTGPPSSNFGSVSQAGDMNNDGYDDILIGAWRLNKAYVIYGRDNSLMTDINLNTQPLVPSSTGFMITGPTSSSFGFLLSPAGDFNSDGHDDIIIGPISGDKAFVIYGRDNSVMTDVNVITQPLVPSTTGFMIQGSGTTSVSLSTAGDLDRDGYDDIIIGINTGSPVYVIYACSSCPTCPVNCKRCSSASVCTECRSPNILYQSGCFGSCPDGTFSSAGTCQACSSSCDTCSGSASTCTGCISSKFLYQSQCVSSCPDGTFPSLGKCEACSSSCFTCSGGASTCTGCISSEFLYQFQCVGSCPPTTFPLTGNCEDCPTDCDQCSSSSVCTLCRSPNFLYQSACVASCPGGTFSSAGTCQACPTHCTSCTSQASCQTCEQGYIISNSLCALSSSSFSSSPSLSQRAQEKATSAISSGAKGIGSVVCVGSSTAPVAALVSKTVQNTRYLNLSITTELAEIYQTWDTDLISWDVPNILENKGNFKTSPDLFARYGLDSPFLTNFWPTLMNLGISLTAFIVFFIIQKLFEKSKNESWISSVVERLLAGSFNFALIQAYACLDDILFYLVLDLKTNSFEGFFSWASVISAFVFLVIGCLLVFFNFWTVRKYQQAKSQGVKAVEDFNERNKYWELFYSDFNDGDLWSQSFFATLIIRSTLSSFIITVLYDYPLMQTAFLLILDGVIIMILCLKKPFNTLRGTLAQYYYEIITLLVHLCTFILAFQDSSNNPSAKLKNILCSSILYLNTGLVGGSLGFMFIEIYETIKFKIKAKKRKQRETMPKDSQETQNLTLATHQLQPRDNREQTVSIDDFYILSGVNQNGNNRHYDFGMESSHAQESSWNRDNSIVLDMDPSYRNNQQRFQMKRPTVLRQQPIMIKHRQPRNINRSRNMNQMRNIRQFEDT